MSFQNIYFKHPKLRIVIQTLLIKKKIKQKTKQKNSYQKNSQLLVVAFSPGGIEVTLVKKWAEIGFGIYKSDRESSNAEWINLMVILFIGQRDWWEKMRVEFRVYKEREIEDCCCWGRWNVHAPRQRGHWSM